MKRIVIINGPNLNLLGKREPEVYGNKSFESYFEELKNEFEDFELEYFQSNSEGNIIDKIHQTGFHFDGIILNAGAFTHTSLAIADAVRSVPAPVVEVHISNVFKRESYRHHSFLSEAAKGCIVGFGLNSYWLALQSFEIASMFLVFLPTNYLKN
ncbi:MAG: type II 3-dehydroquinate dehydratase [Paludibacteraceae bacterium]